MSEANTQVKPTLAAAIEMIEALSLRVAKLEATAQPVRNEAQRDMTDDDARRILTGDLKATKHKEAAATLGLSYGQVYSCRLEFTFKNIHKEMKEAGVKNEWAKA